MLNCSQFRSLIIGPVLSKLQMSSKSAEELLVFTCAAESDGGTYIHQVNGTALGIYQMQPKAYTDLWTKYIFANNRLAVLLSMHFQCGRMPDVERLIYDLAFATVMTRIYYMTSKEGLPAPDDINGIWAYYKQHYNTPKGKAEQESTIAKYEAFIKN